MARELVFTGPRSVDFRDVPAQPLGERDIRLRTILSGISHGTEMSLYRATAPGITKGLVDGLFREGEGPVYQYPFPYGYEGLGEVIEVGGKITEFQVGDKVFAWYGHRDEVVVPVDNNDTLFLLPADPNYERFIFLALSSVAFDSFLTSGLRLSESAVIFGQGAVGLLLTQICKIAGARPVIVVDMIKERLDLARRVGADHALTPRDRPAVDAVRELLPDTKGADVVFEASGTYRGLHEAIRCGAPIYSKLVTTSSYLGDATDLRLGEEFCHGGSLLQGGCSQILTNNSRLPPAFGRQWHHRRVWETCYELLRSGRLNAEVLITHRFPFERAAEALELIDQHPEQTIKTVLTF